MFFMGATKSHINPTCWAVKGSYNGMDYDGISVVPVLEQEKIQFTITMDNGDLKLIEEVPFPAHLHDEQMYMQIMKRVLGHKLHVLL